MSAIMLVRKVRATLINITTLIPLLAATLAVQAQPPLESELPSAAFTIELDEQPPVYSALRTGEFANGLHYYILENEEPAQRAELRLVVDVGSVLEDDSQLGLAHFLEHMAFNGSENFSSDQLLATLQGMGMNIGPEVNAYTSFDETIYVLQVPTTNPEFMRTAFQIMDDWASGLTLDAAEIESERGVVIEEWRQGQGAQTRVRDKQIPVLLKDSRYAERFPIGTLENLQNFDPDELRRFYNDWYRPDLMAVIAVGDFDGAEIERLVREHFETIPAAVNPRERTRYGVPEHADTLFSIVTDPEISGTQTAVYNKEPATYDWTIGGYRDRLVERLYDAMLSTRLGELTRQPNPPFMGAASTEASMARTLFTHAMMATVPDAGASRGLAALFAEAERVARFGFTAAELERQKTVLLRFAEQQYANRATRPSSSHAAELIRAYLTGESVPGAEFETALYMRFVPEITLEEVNQVGKNYSSSANRVVAVVAPEKAGLAPPTATELSAVIESVATTELTAHEDNTSDAPLMATIPQGSPVTQTQMLDGGLTEWTLSNGIKVILKPTEFRQDEIVFTGFSPGGTSLASDEDFIPASTAVAVIANGGVGTFNGIDLQRKLTGKFVNVTPYISEFDEGVRGGGTPADLETMMQLIYLRMTAPRADPAFFEIFKTQSRAALQNRTANPGTVFDDTFNRLLYQNHLRRQPPAPELLDKVDLAKSLAFYQDRLGDATDATFIFVGNLDLAVMQPLVETYIGGLPTSGRKETWRDLGIRSPTAVVEETIKRGLEPKSSTRIAFTGPFDVADMNERTLMYATADILQAELQNVMREQLGGTYTVQVTRQLSWQPIPAYTATITFGSDPERADELTAALFAELELLQREGPSEADLAGTRQSLLRAWESGLQQNNYWLSQLALAYSSGINPGAGDILRYPETLNALTVDAVRGALQKYFTRDSYIRVTLLPED